jgi:hypothetical protein
MKKSFIIASMAALAALCFSLTAQAQGPVVVSDKDDYAPGETAMFSAAGFEPNELLDFSVAIQDENGGWLPDIAWADVPADASGGAEVDYIVPQTWADKTLQLTVMGLTSSLMASTTFTDHGTDPTLTYSNWSISASGNTLTISVDIAMSGNITGHAISDVQAVVDPGGLAVPLSLTTLIPAGNSHGTGTWSGSIDGSCETTYTLSKLNPVKVTGSGPNPNHVYNNIAAPAGTTATTGACSSTNNPPVITCASPAPTPDLGSAVGCLGDGNSFCHDFSVSYGCSPASCEGNPVTVQATFTKSDNTTVTVDVATAMDPDAGDTVTVTLGTGTNPVTICGPGSGMTDFSVQFTAHDNDNVYADPAGDCGGTASAQIAYAFNGFFPPLSGQINTKVKRGSGVPVKFQIADCDGTLITPDNFPGDATMYPAINVTKLSGITPAGLDIDDAGFSGDDGYLYRWDPTGMQWIFNLKTNSTYDIGCTYLIWADLGDGVDHNVPIAIK